MPELPIIVGAGPVGLAAATFLTRQKTPVRLIDHLPERSKYSKALAVNPRTLELLESTGVTERMLAIGKKIEGVTFWGKGEPIARVNFADLPHKYPFLLAIAQGTSERLLEEALIESGGGIERGTALTTCRTLIGKVEATFKSGEVAQAPWMFAADGARSAVRHAMKVDFAGSQFKKEWSLVDVPMEIDLPEDRAHILFLPVGGFLFCMRVVGDGEENNRRPLWRVMGDVPNPIERLAEQRSLSADAPVWTSSFRIGHRIASTLQMDKICLGGDAAHIHSPAGARGMNLGIEDAWEFSQRVMRGSFAGYGRSRRLIDRAVVRRIKMITRMAQGESFFTRAIRSMVLPLASDVPMIRRRLLLTISGLDHPLAID